jgi:hypothetical protein
MGTVRTRLEGLRRAAETAAGAMREVADNLDEVRDTAPRLASKAWRLAIEQNADRLRLAADCLVAEANAEDPWTTRHVARVAAAVLAATGALGLAAAQGGSEAYVDKLMSSRDRAWQCVRDVGVEAKDAAASLTSLVQAEFRRVADLLRSGAAVEGHNWEEWGRDVDLREAVAALRVTFEGAETFADVGQVESALSDLERLATTAAIHAETDADQL